MSLQAAVRVRQEAVARNFYTSQCIRQNGGLILFRNDPILTEENDLLHWHQTSSATMADENLDEDGSQ